VARLQDALRAGLAHLGDIASSYNGHGGRSGAYEAYLRSNIVFGLGEAEAAGLREFFRRACAIGLIAGVPELRFHAHP
jgi:hypothetical protein